MRAPALTSICGFAVTVSLAGCGSTPRQASMNDDAPRPEAAQEVANSMNAPSDADVRYQTVGAMSQKAPAGVFNADLRDELLEMRDADQSLRVRIGQTPTGERRELFERIAEKNREHVDRLSKIIDEHGWPTISMVGRDGAEAAWLIAQHADHDAVFRERCMTLMRQAAERGEASRAHLAYLVDRVMVDLAGEQFYGTQFHHTDEGYVPVPIIDRARLEERRAAAGLIPFDRYLDAMMARRPGDAPDEAMDANGEQGALAQDAPAPNGDAPDNGPMPSVAGRAAMALNEALGLDESGEPDEADEADGEQAQATVDPDKD